MRQRHLHDDIAPEPVGAALDRELVDGGRIAAGVDRPAHQHHAGGDVGIVGSIHQRHGGEHRHRGLAHRHDVAAGAEVVDHLEQVVDIVVEIEMALGEFDLAGIGPVGDVDVGLRQHGLDGSTQQGRIVARHRGDDQELLAFGSD